MNDAAWGRLVEAIDLGAGIDRHGKEKRTAEDRPDIDLSVEFYEFNRGADRLRLERITGPAVIDRKSHYTKTTGGAVRFENIYDLTQVSHRVVLLKQKDGEWIETPLDALQQP